jgi:hypothetical protein
MILTEKFVLFAKMSRLFCIFVAYLFSVLCVEVGSLLLPWDEAVDGFPASKVHDLLPVHLQDMLVTGE